MSKYQFGVIYKITNTKNGEIYIGSTTMDVELRLVKHKCEARKRPQLSQFYTYMKEQGIDDFAIEVVEEFPCNSKKELEKREGEIIREIGTLNSRIAGRTNQEYKNEFKDYLIEFARENNKKWRINNREHYLEKERGYKKKYREKYKEQLKEKASERVECECGCSYRKSDKSQHLQSKKHLKALGLFNEEEYKQSKQCQQLKKQYEKYKDTIDEDKAKEQKKNWYEKNKGAMSEKSKERVTCECGVEVCKGAYTRHLKSKFHQNYLNNNIENNVPSIQEKTDDHKLETTNEQA